MNNGIQPTVELATNNGSYPYPVMPAYGYGNGGNGFFNGDGVWLILLLALIWGGNNGNGGFFGNNSFDNGYAWLSNGQKEIMQNTNNGFDTLHLSNQMESVQNSINGISNQICNSTSDITSAISNGFYNSEISANNRQMADMQQNYANQLSTLNSFNGLERQLCECCSDNRLATERLNATILSENCADREALSNGLRDILTSQSNNVRDLIANQTMNTQRILDQLCSDRISQKEEKINDLERELLLKNLQASQIAQTQAITSNVYNELKNCPVGTVPVFGNQPIFSCPTNLNGGCGCGCGNYTNVI